MPNGQPLRIAADYYIAAMPVEIMTALVADSLKTLAPSLAELSNLKVAVDERHSVLPGEGCPAGFGHTLYADSPWALTSISQRQFWRGVPLANFGGGKLGGILSVDISEWEVPGILSANPPCNAARKRSRTKCGRKSRCT